MVIYTALYVCTIYNIVKLFHVMQCVNDSRSIMYTDFIEIYEYSLGQARATSKLASCQYKFHVHKNLLGNTDLANIYIQKRIKTRYTNPLYEELLHKFSTFLVCTFMTQRITSVYWYSIKGWYVRSSHEKWFTAISV